MKTLFPKSKTQLEDLESRTVGEWFDKISSNLKNLEAQKEEVSLEESVLRKRHILRQTWWVTITIMAFSGVAKVCEWYDEDSGCFRIKVHVRNRVWGKLFGYSGSFAAEWNACTAAEIPEHVKPLREERRE